MAAEATEARGGAGAGGAGGGRRQTGGAPGEDNDSVGSKPASECGARARGSACVHTTHTHTRARACASPPPPLRPRPPPPASPPPRAAASGPQRPGAGKQAAKANWGKKPKIIEDINELIEELDNITSSITSQVGGRGARGRGGERVWWCACV